MCLPISHREAGSVLGVALQLSTPELRLNPCCIFHGACLLIVRLFSILIGHL